MSDVLYANTKRFIEEGEGATVLPCIDAQPSVGLQTVRLSEIPDQQQLPLAPAALICEYVLVEHKQSYKQTDSMKPLTRFRSFSFSFRFAALPASLPGA